VRSARRRSASEDASAYAYVFSHKPFFFVDHRKDTSTNRKVTTTRP
jgi:hypothetical protein